MSYLFEKSIRVLLLMNLLLFSASINYGQTGNNPPKKDTSLNKTNTNKWKNESVKIGYEKLNDVKTYYVDTDIHSFQHMSFTEPWYRDMGNFGSPALNLLFTPEDRFEPSLGYHAFDIYRYNIDSLNYYNTNRPYSVFTYRLANQVEQMLDIMHSQNIKPNLNFAIQYFNITSPGDFKIQRNAINNIYLTANYKSLNRHYTANLAVVYNQIQHDENGGILNAREFDSVDNSGNKIYTDRKTLDVVNQNDNFSITRSPVVNNLYEFSLMFQQNYIWGHIDTTYNKDSTQYSFKLKPRFSLTHKLEFSNEIHSYNDLTPDSMRYVSLFNHSFSSAGTGYYTPGGDSVYAEQDWFWIDNNLLFNGFIGEIDKQVKFSAGIGNRYDRFTSTPIPNFISGKNVSDMFNNYLEGIICKEALALGQWAYKADAKLYIVGQNAGNFKLHATIAKEMKKAGNSFFAGFQQQINSAPYSYTNYENLYTDTVFHFNKESVTMVFANIEDKSLRFSAGIKNYLINNYIYINQNEVPAQYSSPINIFQAWIKKVFKVGNFYLDNQIVLQQQSENAPVNVPAFMGKHQLTYENGLFHKALKIAIGIEVRYNTPYKPSGYDFLLNKFYYQNSTVVSNIPEASIFLNFKIKNRFRCFLMIDQLQQLVLNVNNPILFIGSPISSSTNSELNYIPVYAAQTPVYRLGFSWVLIN